MFNVLCKIPLMQLKVTSGIVSAICLTVLFFFFSWLAYVLLVRCNLFITTIQVQMMCYMPNSGKSANVRHNIFTDHRFNEKMIEKVHANEYTLK